MPWKIQGWPDALRWLELQSPEWRGRWIFVQYTALAWSARGFPGKILSVLRILKASGSRVCMVFHDVEPYPGTRLVDSARRFFQIYTLRHAVALADLNLFTVPLDRISWLTGTPHNAAYLPVGPNLPIPKVLPSSRNISAPMTIGVFSITGGKAGVSETRTILAAVRHAAVKLGRLRLSIFGRYADLQESEFRVGLRNTQVELSIDGVVEPIQVVQKLCACDVLLFVRGPISSRRSSAIAGIACGLPVIGYPGSETAAPVTEAGVILVSPDRPEELHNALVQVLSEPTYRRDLSGRSLVAFDRYFSWDAIATQFSELLKHR